MRFRNLAINLGAIAILGAITLSLQLPKLNQRLSGQTQEETRKAVRDPILSIAILGF